MFRFYKRISSSSPAALSWILSRFLLGFTWDCKAVNISFSDDSQITVYNLIWNILNSTGVLQWSSIICKLSLHLSKFSHKQTPKAAFKCADALNHSFWNNSFLETCQVDSQVRSCSGHFRVWKCCFVGQCATTVHGYTI